MKITVMIQRKELTIKKMIAGNEEVIKQVIMDGNVHRWVGIGWVEEGPPTAAQKRKLPHVID